MNINSSAAAAAAAATTTTTTTNNNKFAVCRNSGANVCYCLLYSFCNVFRQATLHFVLESHIKPTHGFNVKNSFCRCKSSCFRI